MHSSVLITLAGVLAALTWAYLLLARGGFWHVGRLALPAASGTEPPGRVAVVIPARNEAEVIARSIASLLGHDGSRWLDVILVNDGSTDGTTERAREAASQTGRSAALTVVEGRPLPPGWSGKLWALQQGIEKARALDPRFLLLTDADIQHSPQNIGVLVALADTGGYDLVSLMAKLRCETFAEKLLIPAFVFFFFKLYPPAWIADSRRATAGAAGGCILVRPQALARAGGLEAIRGEIIDDCALARAVKGSGGKAWLGLAADTVSLRRYGSFAEIGRMIARTAFSQLRHSTLLLLAALAGMAVIYLLPPALVLTGDALPRTLGAVVWAAMTLAYLPMVRFYGLNPLWALGLPLTALFYMGATIESALKYWSGRGGEWKGRVQDPA
jgi:hopene-associated glycosyltransferase HpnB